MFGGVTPEKALGLAIIKRAVEDALGYQILTTEDAYWGREAMAWLFQAWTDKPFTFPWWCEQLDVDATRVRRFVIESKPRDKMAARAGNHQELLRWIFDEDESPQIRIRRAK